MAGPEQGRNFMKKLIVIALGVVIAAAVLIQFQNRETQLNYRLKWLFNSSVAGDIFANANGYFDQAGLTVNIKEGSPEKNAINELELGHADFGVASADQVIRAVDKGAKIVVIAQLFQMNPMQWIYRADQPVIKTLQDLKGRRIGVTFGGNDETIMKTLLNKAGIDESEVTLTGVRFDFTPFFKRQVDVWPVYRNSQGVILEDKLAREGEAVYFFNPADFGINFVANSVITTEAMVKDKPKRVKKFLRALLKGWEAAMDPVNETAVLAAVKKLDKGTQGMIRKEQLAATRKLIKPLPSTGIGTIDIAAWKQTEQIMLKEKQIKGPVNIETRLVQTE
jgi:NitT/TauT family transport system substrate-binding protein